MVVSPEKKEMFAWLFSGGLGAVFTVYWWAFQVAFFRGFAGGFDGKKVEFCGCF